MARLTFCHPVLPKIDINLLINSPNLYWDLSKSKQKRVLFLVLPNYYEQFSSNQTTKIYPEVLTELYEEKYKGLIYANLLFKCN